MVTSTITTVDLWPGIICPDLVNGQHVTHDLDGYVESNHVEYLGDPHSRGWVAVKHSSHYSTSVKPECCRRQKKWYKSVLEEANKPLARSSEQRIRHLSSKGGKTDASNDTELSKRRNKQVGKRSTCGTGQKRKKKMLRFFLLTTGSDDILSKDNLGQLHFLTAGLSFNSRDLEREGCLRQNFPLQVRLVPKEYNYMYYTNSFFSLLKSLLRMVETVIQIDFRDS
ncbi:PREDICTED: zinc finger CW-type PWWP domain protein 2 [Crocodylus porosus]|uniref:zinc finger CW-type PWWP domain protein 2 n=1 Tax=Crocodylus porosus TaxID=8502 RepID=UPI000938F16A|nr:PREDICTED: zinc finger CW-type PWWP domain protein 2 [Crocodylus porosus]